MAAFGNYQGTQIITASDLTSLQGHTRFIVIRSTDFNDNHRGGFWQPDHLDYLIKDFKHTCAKIAALDNFACRPRERIVGRDYKTPSGTRPYWFRPEASSVDPPVGVSLPRWREYQRRRSA